MPYVHSQYLVETEWLSEHLGDRALRVLDVTSMLTKELNNVARQRAYDAGHIPGAVFLDMASGKGALSDPEAELPWTWPSRTRVEEAMASVGVNDDTRVILYAASPRPGVDFGPMWATRAWWILHHFGVDCAILNGGYEKWILEDRPIATIAEVSPRGSFSAKSDGLHAIATKEEVQAAREQTSVCIVDALSAESFSGAKPLNSVQRKGHITGALNVPMSTVINVDGSTFVHAKTLISRLANAGVAIDQPVITYCGGGIAATLDAFALKLVGATDVRVYDGSLSEWSADEALPMSTLPEHDA